MSIPLYVLLVEDSENDALLVIEELRIRGFEPAWDRVETAQAMREALDQHAWDIIIADNSLPRFSGIGALEIAQEKDPDLPLILISGQLKEEEAVEAMRAGARDFISKNNLSRLAPAVEREVHEAKFRRERREAQELFEKAFRLAPEIMSITNLETRRYLDVNHAFEHLLGYTREEVIGRTSIELNIMADNDLRDNLFQTLMAGESVQNWEIPIWTQSGTILTTLYSAEAVEFRGQKCMLAVAADITERKKAEEREREREAEKADFYCRLILAATDGKLLVTDHAEIERIAGPAIATLQIRNPNDLSIIRRCIAGEAKTAGMDDSRIEKFILGIGEATTNALKHAGGGMVSIHRTPEGMVSMISDKGPGIAALSLPEVALRRSYSTVGTLGVGYKVMIRSADKVYMASTPEGTTVGIEMNLHAPETHPFGIPMLDMTASCSTVPEKGSM